VAAASALVLVIGNLKWWGSNAEVAGGNETESAATAPSATPAQAPTPSGSETMSLFGAAAVELVANKQQWSTISCGLAPRGWSAETPITAGHVVLSQPAMRTAGTATKVVLQAAPDARSLSAVRVQDLDGKAFHLGTLDGRAAGQVKLADQWLLVELPTGTADWTDDVLRRFMDSCTLN
jgi:hypothetical protein